MSKYNPFSNYESDVNYNVPDPFYGIDKSTLSAHVTDAFIGDILDTAEKGVELVGKLFKKRELSKDQGIKNAIAVAQAALAGLDEATIKQVYEETKRTKKSYWNKDYAGKSNEDKAKFAVNFMNRLLAEKGERPIPFEEFKATFQDGKKPSVMDEKATTPDEAFNKLLPFKEKMQKTLALKGITPSNRIDILSNQFYNEIVTANMFDNYGYPRYQKFSLYSLPVDQADAATDAIITGIIEYIKNLEKKKEEGGTLTKGEEVILQGKGKVSEKIEEAAKSTAAEKTGEFLLFKGGWIWIAGGIAAIILIVVLARKK